MPETSTDTLTRLRAANPVCVSAEGAHEPAAQAALERILLDPERSPATSATRSWRMRRPVGPGRRSVSGFAVLLALMVVCGGGALAAIDPFGWWSANRDEARYGANPAVHVTTPKAQNIRCRAGTGGHFTCTPARYACTAAPGGPPSCALTGTGLAYTRLDAIRPPLSAGFSRAFVQSAISRGIAARTLTSAQAARIRADLARVPESFFTELRLASRYGTFGNQSTNRRGQELVPPPGVPDILVCESAGQNLLCRDLNGDLNAPIGAGVYGAVPAKGWRTVTVSRENGSLPPGVHFSHADMQLLFDLLRITTTTHSPGGGHIAKTIPVTPARTPQPGTTG